MVTSTPFGNDGWFDLVEQAAVAVVVDDAQGNVVYANVAAAELFGCTRDDLKAIVPGGLVHADDRERVMSLHRGRLAGRDVPTAYRFTGLRRDGTQCRLEVAARVWSEDGRPAGTVSFLSDATTRETTDERLLRVEVAEAVARFTGGFAKRLIGLLEKMAGLGAGDAGAEQQRRALLARATVLTRDLLVVGRCERASSAPLDLNAVAAEAVILVRSILPERVTLAVEPYGEALLATGDSALLAHAVASVVASALEGRREVANLVIAAAARGAEVAVTIAHDGAVLAEGSGDWSLETYLTTTDAPRRSLGLAAADHLVRQMGGRVELEPLQPRGQVCRFLLPRRGASQAVVATEPDGTFARICRDTAARANDQLRGGAECRRAPKIVVEA